MYALMAALVTLGVVRLYDHLMTHEKFRVARISIHGGSDATQLAVADELEAFVGVNVFRCDLSAVKTAAMERNWVEDVIVGRELPNKLRIVVRERTAHGIARIGSELWAIDAMGEPIDRVETMPQLLDVPVLTGVAQRTSDQQQALQKGLEALALIKETSLLFWSHMETLDISNPHNLVVQLSLDPTPIYLGSFPNAENVERYLLVADHIQHKYPDLAYVELGFNDQVSIMPLAASR